MDTDSINGIYYYIIYVIEWLSHWMTYLKIRLAGTPLEIQIAIGIIIGAVIIIALMLLLTVWQAINRRKERKTLKKLDDRYGAVIEMLLNDDAQELPRGKRSETESKALQGLKEVAALFNVKVPTREEAEDLIMEKRKSGSKRPTDIETDKKVVEEIKNNAQVFVQKKREKRQLCLLIYNRLIHDTGKLCSINNLHFILELFDLPKFMETEVDHGNMKRKVRTMTMMNIFRLGINPWLTNTLLHSRNPQVRRQAMYASIMSGLESNMDYFESDFFDKNSCMRDEIEMGYALGRRKEAGIQLPNLARLAHIHQHAETQCIFIRMMQRFHQNDHCKQLEDLFQKSRNKGLTKEIARSWGFLGYKAGEPLLMEALPTQSDDTKIVLMQALTRMNTGQALEILVEGFTKSTNPELRFEALRCLYNYGSQGKEKFGSLERKEKDKNYFEFFENDFSKKFIPLEEEPVYKMPIDEKTSVYHWTVKN